VGESSNVRFYLWFHLTKSLHRFLRVVDRFNNLAVSAYVTPGGIYLLLLHDGRGEDAIRGFFTEIHDLYTKYILNPFAILDGPIVSPQFDSHVRMASRRFLSL
jgi:trafficking protein particle complex subunit 2